MSTTKRITNVDSSTSFDKVFVNDKNAIKQITKADFLTNGGIAKASDMEQAKSDITALYKAVGSPLLANTVAGMTDTNKIYVYNGTESGYTKGNWYYYNGSSWVSGGTYNANPITIDNTLTVQGDAADAKKVGDEIGAIKNDLNQLEDKVEGAYNAYVIDTASGAIASFPDGADDVPVKDLLVNIEPVQSGSGDPSPENVRPITGWTGLSGVRTGENLLDENLIEQGNYDGGNPNNCVIKKMPIKGGTYMWSQSSSVTGRYIRFYDANMVVRDASASVTQYNTVNATFNAPSWAEYCGVVWYSPNEITPADVKALNPMIELGSTATSYEPYTGQPISVNWETEAGTVYGGTLDVVSGVLTVDTARIALSSLDFAVINDNYFYSGVTGIAYNSARIWSDTYKSTVPYNGYNEINFENCSIAISQINARIAIRDDSYSDVASFVASLTDKYIVYGLATPQTYQLTPQEVSTILGQNNIFADTGNVTVQYRADTKLYIDKVLA